MPIESVSRMIYISSSVSISCMFANLIFFHFKPQRNALYNYRKDIAHKWLHIFYWFPFPFRSMCFLLSLRCPPWRMHYLEACSWFLSVWIISCYFSVNEFQFYFVVVRQHTGSDSGAFRFAETNFTAQNIIWFS